MVQKRSLHASFAQKSTNPDSKTEITERKTPPVNISIIFHPYPSQPTACHFPTCWQLAQPPPAPPPMGHSLASELLLHRGVLAAQRGRSFGPRPPQQVRLAACASAVVVCGAEVQMSCGQLSLWQSLDVGYCLGSELQEWVSG